MSNMLQLQQNLTASLVAFDTAASMVRRHAKESQKINDHMATIKEQVGTAFNELYSEFPAQFSGLAGVTLAEKFHGTMSKDRKSFEKAVERGIKIGSAGLILKLSFPRSWDSRSVVVVRLVEPKQPPSDLDKLLGMLSGLNDADLNRVIIESRKLTKDREEVASEADTARQMIAAAQAEADSA